MKHTICKGMTLISGKEKELEDKINNTRLECPKNCGLLPKGKKIKTKTYKI